MAPSTLRRELSVPMAVALAVSTIIGSGLLGLPGIAIAATSPVDALAGWGIAIVLSVPLMLVFMELTRTTGSAGGLATYVGMALGPDARAATAVLLALTFALCIPLGTIMGAAYLTAVLGLPDGATYVIAAGVIVVATLVNVLGVRSSSVVNALSVAALVALVALIVASNPDLTRDGLAMGADLAAGAVAPTSWASLWAATAILFWAFLGWENLSFSGEDMKDSQRSVVAVFVIAFVVVTGLYVLLAAVASGAAASGLPVDHVAGLIALLPSGRGALVVDVLIAVVVVANVNAWVFAASRLYFGMARDGVFPRALARLNGAGAPALSLVLLAGIYVAVIATVGLELLPLELGLMLANQNFVVVYMGAVLCLLLFGRGAFRKGLALVALASCSVFVAGFGVMLLLPLAILASVALGARVWRRTGEAAGAA
ncbi:APC family permease [Salinarimonas ramus]|uniref:L-methionine/branched-chain amino acid transporter n=1 Tax=Salinarimonas ramus TaxID=690164 RepID=A0A917QCG9_9HYPH|nr:amino acid permease [Salinarimonas ramus]GGK43207.1 L-methionine/branched-chain amino acid transporter [Salinarimonas ramus]